MPWNNQNGGGRPGGGGRGPWGNGPSHGGGSPPDLEDLLKRGQDKLRQALPRGIGGGGATIAGLIVVALVPSITLWLPAQFGLHVAR